MDLPCVTSVFVTMNNAAVNTLEHISLWTGVLWVFFFLRQSIYLGPKNYNSGSRDSGGNLNSVLITGEGLRTFMGKREEDEVSCIF